MELRDLVQYVLEKYPSARDNDLDLLARVWYHQGFKMSKEHYDFFLKHCTTPESITRLRREFQASGQYKPKPLIEKQRSFLEGRYHERYSKEPDSDFDQVMDDLFG